MNDEELRYYSAALDEVYTLRAALAHEARVRRRDLELRSYPSGRRAAGERAVERMIAAAGGRSREAYPTTEFDCHEALAAVDADHGLSRGQWEQEVDARRRRGGCATTATGQEPSPIQEGP